MSPRSIRKAVIPAAGLGTRFLPATKVVPKELLPLLTKPAIQYAVEEAVASGITSLVIVINERKASIRDYFRSDPPLETLLLKQGKVRQLEIIRGLSRLCDIEVVYQDAPTGLGHAVGCARKHIAGEPFAVLLPDVIILSDVPCTRQLSACFERHSGCILATREVDPAEVSKFGILALPASRRDLDGDTLRIADLVEKPAPGSEPSRLGIFGRYVLEPEIFDYIAACPSDCNGEVQLTAALARYAHDHAVYGCLFDGKHFDIGEELGFLQAGLELVLRDPTMRKRMIPYLQSRLAELRIPVVD